MENQTLVLGQLDSLFSITQMISIVVLLEKWENVYTSKYLRFMNG